MMCGAAAIVSGHVKCSESLSHCNQKPYLLLPNRDSSLRQRMVYLSSVFCLLSSVMSDDHSELVPLLPIPNRTVKRLRANDSVDYPCESRSSSDSLQTKNPASCRVFCLVLNQDTHSRVANSTASLVFQGTRL